MMGFLEAFASILGIMLTSIGVIGEERLKNLERKVRQFVSMSLDELEFRLFGGSEKARTYFGFMMYGVVGLALCLSFVLGYDHPLVVNVYRFILLPLLFILVFIVALMSIIYYSILLLSLPYRLLDKIVIRTKLESTFVFIGILLSIIGSLLDE